MVNNDPLHLVGTTLAHKYAMESVVRIEAGAVVYRATNLATNRSIAIRVLGALAQLAPGKQRALYERLARDHEKLDELAAILPAAYPIRDVGTVGTAPRGKIPWVALEWPQGVTLAQMMQPGHDAALPESIDEVVALLEPIAVALAIAHEHGGAGALSRRRDRRATAWDAARLRRRARPLRARREERRDRRGRRACARHADGAGPGALLRRRCVAGGPRDAARARRGRERRD